MKLQVQTTTVTVPANEALKRKEKKQHYVIIDDIAINIGEENFNLINKKIEENGKLDTATISQPEAKANNMDSHKQKR